MEKSVVIYSYSGTLYSEENKQNTSTHYKMDESSKHNVEEASYKRVCTVGFHLCNIQNQAKLICDAGSPDGGCPCRAGGGAVTRLEEGVRGPLRA